METSKQRREFMRWILLLALDKSRPIGAWEEVLVSTVQGMWADATKLEVRRELDYLDERKLAQVKKHPDGRWFAELTHHGVDFVEYTIDAHPGIARPAKL